MNDYMRRLVNSSSTSSKKKKNKADDKTKTDVIIKATLPQSETVAATKPRSFRRRNRIISPPEKTNQTETPVATTRTKLGSHRFLRLGNGGGGKSSGSSSLLLSSSSSSFQGGEALQPRDSQLTLQPNTKDCTSNIKNINIKAEDEPPTKESWMSLAKDSSDSENNDTCVSYGDDCEQIRTEYSSKNNNDNNNNDTGNRFYRSNNNYDSTASTHMTTTDPLSPSRSLLLEKENLERELADVQMDRDIMRQQLLEARKELEEARTSLRDHISDLEHQRRTFQQSQQRQTELEENSLLEQELDQLARLTKEQEEKVKLAAKERDGSHSFKESGGISTADNVGGDSVDYDEFSISTIDGASSVIVESSPPPKRHSTRLYNDRVIELEEALKERKFREQILEKEVRQLKKQAQVESQKFKETQRQVQWFQEELQTLAAQEDSEETVSFSQGIARGRYSNNDNVDNNADLGIILEDSVGNDDGKKKEEDDNGTYPKPEKKIANDDTVGVNDDDIVGINVTASSFPPSSSESQDYSNHVMLLHQQRLELENRVQVLLDEVGRLRQEQGVLEHEKQQHSIKLQQLQTDTQQQLAQNQLENLLVERQLKEWKDRSVSFQKELQEERHHAEKQNTSTRLERHELRRWVEELEIHKSKLENKLKTDGVQFDHERGLLKRTIQSLEEKVQVASISNSDDNDTTLSDNSSDTQDTSQSRALSLKHNMDDITHLEHQGLLDQIKILEVDTESHEELEHTLRWQLQDMTKQAKTAKDQAAKAEDRVHVLQTFLGASMSASPSSQRQLEIEQEYFSDNKVKGKLQIVPEDEMQKSDNIDANPMNGNVDNSDYHTTIKDDSFFDVQEEACKLSVDSARNLSAGSRERILKMREMEEQSNSNNAVVHNLHLRLDQEMEQLKHRKERRKERSMSSTSPGDSVRKERSLLDTSSNDIITHEIEKKDSKPDAASTNIPRSQSKVSMSETLTVEINDQIESGQSVDSTKHNHATEKSGFVEKEQSNILKGGNPPVSITEKKSRIKSPDVASLDRDMLVGDESESMQSIAEYEERLQKAKLQVNRFQQELNDCKVEKEEAETAHKKSLIEHSEFKDKLVDTSAIQIESLETELTELKCEKEDLESKLSEKSKGEAKLIEKLEKYNTRSAAALDAVNEENTRLEVQLTNAVNQTKNSVDQVDALNLQITTYRSSLDQYEIEKTTLRDQTEKEILILEAAYTSKLKAEYDFKDTALREEQDTIRLKMEQIEIALAQSRKERIALEVELERVQAEFAQMQNTLYAEKESMKVEIERSGATLTAIQEENKILISQRIVLEEKLKCLEEKESLSRTQKDLCEILEQKIILLEIESKANIERLSTERENVLEEQNLVKQVQNTLNAEKESMKVEIERLGATLNAVQEERQNLDSQRIVLEERLRVLEEEKERLSRIHKDQCEVLEQKIILIETESKANIEHLSIEKENVLEERSLAELKVRDADKLLDESKDHESMLARSLQEALDELKVAQDENQNMSKINEHESAVFGREKLSLKAVILEKNQCIADIEKGLSCKEKRLEQASMQLSELEKELFVRDEEIERLDSKRQQIGDIASKQLTKMEHSLQEQGKEIYRLEEENSTLQNSVQKHKDQVEKQRGRLLEASLQLSELEGELFAKDDDIENIELKISAIQALEAQQAEAMEDLECQKRDLLEQLQNTNAHMKEIKEKGEVEKIEMRRVSMENKEKDNELVLKQNHLNRQLLTVSKLTEQNDKWQQQLDIVGDEKEELIGNQADITKQIVSLREELKEANGKIDELNDVCTRLQEDVACATEEDEKKRRRLSQMEEQKEVLSQKLESAVDNLADLQKRSKESNQYRNENLSNNVGDTDVNMRKLTGELESLRQSLRSAELQRNEFQVENKSLTNRIRTLVGIEAGNDDTEVADDLRNTRERLVKELTTSLNLSQKREGEIQRLEGKVFELKEHLELMEEGDTNKEQIILSLEGELQQLKERMGHQDIK